MSIPKIRGREARDLLDIWTGDVEGLTFAQLGADRSYGDLFASAPALAETVAWLYEREAYDEDDRVWLTYSWRVEASDGGRVRLMLRDEEVDDLAAWAHYIEPDEAVDLARALLAAAEEARP